MQSHSSMQCHSSMQRHSARLAPGPVLVLDAANAKGGGACNYSYTPATTQGMVVVFSVPAQASLSEFKKN